MARRLRLGARQAPDDHWWSDGLRPGMAHGSAGSREDPVGLEYAIGFVSWRYAMARYSLVRPPRTGFRRMRCSARSIGSGGVPT
jgi:hypothetical protein